MTELRSGTDWTDAIRRLPPGSAVIVRDPDPRARLAKIKALGPVAAGQGVMLLLSAERPTRLAGIGGVHIPETCLSAWRRADIERGGFTFVSASAHSMAGAVRAVRLGVDAILLSPVFRTGSHPQARPLGLGRFEAILKRIRVPVFALGGIGVNQIRRINNGGAMGIAGIGLFFEPGFTRKSGGFRAIGVRRPPGRCRAREVLRRGIFSNQRK